MAQELKIVNSKEVVCNGFVTYTQEVAALAAQGYVVDVRSRYSPQWQLGLFVCNMLLLEDEAEIATNVVDNDIEVKVSVPTVEKVKKPTGRPSKADKVKADLQAKLGEDVNPIR